MWVLVLLRVQYTGGGGHEELSSRVGGAGRAVPDSLSRLGGNKRKGWGKMGGGLATCICPVGSFL